jgi:hypothetical protein
VLLKSTATVNKHGRAPFRLRTANYIIVMKVTVIHIVSTEATFIVVIFDSQVRTYVHTKEDMYRMYVITIGFVV